MATSKTDLSQYMLLCNHKLLGYEEERELLQAAKAGDTSARDALVLHNQKLVTRLAKRAIRIDVEMDDLISEGNIGLLHAIKKFNLAHKVKFASYATWWIKNYMYACIKNRYLIHVPFPQQEQISRLRRGKAKATHRGSRFLDDALRVTEYRFAEYEDSTAKPEAYAIEAAELIDATMSYIAQLNPTERFVIQHRYLSDPILTFKEIGDLLCLTRERCRQIHNVAIDKLQAKIRDADPPR